MLRGWSRDELGERVGLTFGGIQNFESGFNDILYQDAILFGQVFDVKPETFMDEYCKFGKPGYGARIARIRYEYEMTQYEFADLLGVERANLAVWECEFENRLPRRSTFNKIKKLAKDKGIDIIKQAENPDIYPDGYVAFIDGNYGRKIRKIRYAYGLVGADFAKLIGCEPQTPEHWEIECVKPLRRYYPKLKSLAEAKGIDISRLNEDPDYFVTDYEGFMAEQCGRKIKSIRCAYNMNLKDFSKLIGCTDVALGKWEMDRCLPSMKYYKIFEKLAEKKGITMNALNLDPEMYQDEYQNFIRSDYKSLIRKYRKKKNLSQNELGSMIGTPGYTVSDWECGKIVPSRESFNKMMAILMEDDDNDTI